LPPSRRRWTYKAVPETSAQLRQRPLAASRNGFEHVGDAVFSPTVILALPRHATAAAYRSEGPREDPAQTGLPTPPPPRPHCKGHRATCWTHGDAGQGILAEAPRWRRLAPLRRRPSNLKLGPRGPSYRAARHRGRSSPGTGAGGRPCHRSNPHRGDCSVVREPTTGLQLRGTWRSAEGVPTKNAESRSLRRCGSSKQRIVIPHQRLDHRSRPEGCERGEGDHCAGTPRSYAALHGLFHRRGASAAYAHRRSVAAQASRHAARRLPSRDAHYHGG